MSITESEGNDSKPRWIYLDDKKSFSRILYTNPVCFLTTIASQQHQEAAGIPRRNVMVVSWLTAINNGGGFIMSVNKRRHTASVLLSRQDKDTHYNNHNETIFGLCVPVSGMEDLVLSVGKMSGRWGTSKFPGDCHQPSTDVNTQDVCVDGPVPKSKLSPPSKKKKRFEHGIEGLMAVKLGETDVQESSHQDNEDCFAIHGTVAHLKCKVKNVLSDTNDKDIDADHHMILAEVVSGYIRNDYWNEEKKQFFPIKNKEENGIPTPPYMTFFGSQTFGYVVSNQNDTSLR